MPMLGVLAAAIGVCAAVVLQGMFVLAVDDLRDGRQDLSVAQLFARARPMLVPLLLTGILMSLGIMAGLILLIIPGFIFATWWYVSGSVVVLEGQAYGSALRRAHELMRGEGWYLFVLIVITTVMTSCVDFGLSWVFTRFVSGDFAVSLVKQLPGILTGPFGAMVPVLAYFDLRGDTRTGETPIRTV